MLKVDYVFNNMTDAVCILGAKGKIKFVNQSAKDLLFKPDAEVFDVGILECIPVNGVNDEFLQLFMDIVSVEDEQRVEVVDFLDLRDVYHKLRICINHFSDPDDEHKIIALITDITDLIKVTDTFARYTSKSIAEHVLHEEGGDSIGGNLKDTTIIMSDIRGFTAISTQMAPADLIRMVNHYFEEMATIVDKYEGSIIEFLGDGLFIVFGAPNDVDDHPDKAVACAIEMQNAMKQVNQWNAEQGYPELKIGIGINSGEAVVGNLGSYTTTKYGCIGENVNLVGRIETYTIGGQIYISQYTKDRIKKNLDIIASTSFMPKGAKEELTIYDVKGIGAPHNLHMDEVKIELSELENPPEVEFFILTDKTVDNNSAYMCTIKEMGSEFALIVSDAQLEKSQNIQMNIGGALYAKVIEINSKGAMVSFTSKPTCFDEWRNSL